VAEHKATAVNKTSVPQQPFLVNACRLAGTSFVARANRAVNDLTDLLKARRRNDNGISSSSDIFRNLQKSAPLIFPEIERKQLSFDLDLLGE